jgi:hypothetical protein
MIEGPLRVPRRSRGRDRLVVLALVAFACVGSIRASAAPTIKPWTPPNTDSLLVWSADSKARFQTNTGDSVGGANFYAYDLVGFMGRKLLASLGRSGMRQANAIEAVIDSLGLDTEVAIDPHLPQFVLLMVHNPYRPSAASVAFLYWYRERELRQQGVVFHGGHEPDMRVTWTGTSEAPYEWAILSRRPQMDDRMDLLLLRLVGTGSYWALIQYEGSGPDLGEGGDARFVELNGDNRPEIVGWARATGDSSFEECAECPHPMLERLFVAREQGYELYDSRIMPSPLTTFSLFIRLLHEQNRAAAARLLVEPSKLADAVAQGWGTRNGRGVWKLEYTSEEDPWPTWLAFRLKGAKADTHYIVHFTLKDGRWLIQDWVIPKTASTARSTPPSKPKSK